MKLSWFIAVSMMAAAAAAQDPSLESAMERMRNDIETAASELNAVRDTIGEERAELEQRLHAIQHSTARKRDEAERLRRASVSEERRTRQMREEVESLREEFRLMRASLSEYRRTFEQRLPPIYVHELNDRLATIDRALERPDVTAAVTAAVTRVSEMARDWSRRRGRPFKMHGEALDAAGRAREGCYLVFGPAAFFSVKDSEQGGLSYWNWESPVPNMYTDFGPAAAAGITRLCKGASAMVPLDVTGGNAFKVAQARPSFMEHLRRGGAVMIPLLALAALAAAGALLKTFQLMRISARTEVPVREIVAAARAGRREEAEKLMAGLDREHAALLQSGIRHADLPREHFEEIMHEEIQNRAPALERNLGLLALCGGLAPLLGLLGTVTGMIHTFQLVTVFGTGDAKLLSGGISEALVTTETGLIIAVPVLLAHALLRRRVRRIVQHMESIMAAFAEYLEKRASS